MLIVIKLILSLFLIFGLHIFYFLYRDENQNLVCLYIESIVLNLSSLSIISVILATFGLLSDIFLLILGFLSALISIYSFFRLRIMIKTVFKSYWSRYRENRFKINKKHIGYFFVFSIIIFGFYHAIFFPDVSLDVIRTHRVLAEFISTFGEIPHPNSPIPEYWTDPNNHVWQLSAFHVLMGVFLVLEQPAIGRLIIPLAASLTIFYQISTYKKLKLSGNKFIPILLLCTSPMFLALMINSYPETMCMMYLTISFNRIIGYSKDNNNSKDFFYSIFFAGLASSMKFAVGIFGAFIILIIASYKYSKDLVTRKNIPKLVFSATGWTIGLTIYIRNTFLFFNPIFPYFQDEVIKLGIEEIFRQVSAFSKFTPSFLTQLIIFLMSFIFSFFFIILVYYSTYLMLRLVLFTRRVSKKSKKLLLFDVHSKLYSFGVIISILAIMIAIDILSEGFFLNRVFSVIQRNFIFITSEFQIGVPYVAYGPIFLFSMMMSPFFIYKVIQKSSFFDFLVYFIASCFIFVVQVFELGDFFWGPVRYFFSLSIVLVPFYSLYFEDFMKRIQKEGIIFLSFVNTIIKSKKSMISSIGFKQFFRSFFALSCIVLIFFSVVFSFLYIGIGLPKGINTPLLYPFMNPFATDEEDFYHWKPHVAECIQYINRNLSIDAVILTTDYIRYPIVNPFRVLGFHNVGLYESSITDNANFLNTININNISFIVTFLGYTLESKLQNLDIFNNTNFEPIFFQNDSRSNIPNFQYSAIFRVTSS